MSSLQREGYDPEWMEYENSLPPGPMLPSGPGMGEAFCSLMIANARTFPPPPGGVTTYDEKISEHVTVRVYQPPEHQSTTQPRPVVVFYAGGGWVTGNLDTEDHLCRTICGRTDVVIVSVDYRKFPDIQFPENIQDSYDGFQWAYEHASDLHADTSKYVAMGGSAGGGLAVSVVHKLIQSGHRDRISGLVLLTSTNLQRSAVPAEYQHLHTSMTENSGEIPFVTATMSDGVYNLLGGNPPYNEESKHWFPVCMGVEGVKDFPSTWILDCEKDCMRDDGRVLQAEMGDAGLKVKREVVKGMPHYYWAFPVQAAAEDFRKRLVAGLKWVLYSQEDELLN